MRIKAAPPCDCIFLCRSATLWDVTDVNSPVTALILDQTKPRGEVLSQGADINLPERLQLGGSSLQRRRNISFQPKVRGKKQM